jgi:hypothetical protein
MNPVRFTSLEQPAKSVATRAMAMDVRAAWLVMDDSERG